MAFEIRQTFHEDLASLERQLEEMGALVVAMMDDAVHAVLNNDQSKALTVLGRNESLDELNADIDNHCMELLALQQPVARDLRQIVSTLRIITEIEQVGYHAIDIAKLARKLETVSGLQIDLMPLFSLSQSLLKKSLEALANRDSELAQIVCLDDGAVDREFKNVRHTLVNIGQSDATVAKPTSYYLLAAVYLERVADHACNIAERVYYIETGRLQMLTRNHRFSQMHGAT